MLRWIHALVTSSPHLVFGVDPLGQQGVVELENDPVEECAIQALRHRIPRRRRLTHRVVHLVSHLFLHKTL